MMDLECPNCKHLIRIKTDPAPGQFISCSMCHEIFTLTAIQPPTLERLNIGWAEPNSSEKNWKQKSNRSHPYHHGYDEEDDDLFEIRRRAGKIKKRKNFSESD